MNKIFRFSAILLMASVMGGCFTGCGKDTVVDYDYSQIIADLKVSAESLNFGRNGGSSKISVQSEQPVTASSDASWLQVTVGLQSSVLKATSIAISAEANTSGSDRTAMVNISAGGQSKSVSVTQTIDLVVESVTPALVSGEGGLVTINLKSEGPCDVIIDEEATGWITDVTSATRALTASQVLLQVAGHLGAERSAHVTLRATSSDGFSKISETITIRQEKRETSIDTEATAMSIAKQMYPGWNLGNTFEGTSGKASLADETGWQGTKTSQEVIDFVKSQGFRSVRIPCSWHRHMDAANVIDPAWMTRVKEVVDYCMNANLYVVLNDHYDEGWIETKMDTYDESRAAIMSTMWTQVATAFASYDERLMFAGLNEPNADNQTKTDNLVKYEQVFVDAVRATGANNTYRTLLVQGPSTDIDNTSKYYKSLPIDSSKDRLMVEVHFYSPWNFCGMEKDESWGKMFYFWGADNHVSGSNHNANWGEEQYLKDQMKKMKTQFVDKGIPVYIGEYSCLWRELDEHQSEHDASVRLFHEMVVRESINNGCIPVLWDPNYCQHGGTKGSMSVIDRSKLTVWNTFAMEGIQAGTAIGVWPY